MAYGAILGQAPILPENPQTIATNVTYNNSQTSSIITGSNVQQAIDQLFTSVSNGKAQIASAITDKGVSTSANASFAQMAANIGTIQTLNYEQFQGTAKYQSSIDNSYIDVLQVNPIVSLQEGDLCFVKYNQKYLYGEVSSTNSDYTAIRVANYVGYRITFAQNNTYQIVKVDLNLP